jgi:hypothetical protein
LGRRRLSDEEAEARLRAAGAEPLEPYPGTQKPWRSRCLTCGAEVRPRLSSVTQGQGVCVGCGLASSARKRRLSEDEAVRLMREAGAEPLEPYVSRHAPWRCRCLTCGAEVQPRLGGIQGGQGPCVACGIRRNADDRRMPEAHAVALMREAGAEPLEPYRGAMHPWRVRCAECGTVGTPTLNAIQRGQGPCLPCGNRRSGLKRRYAHDQAVARMLEANAQPLEPYPGSQAPWRCRCLGCGKEITPRLWHLKPGYGACWDCGRANAGQKRRLDEAEAIARMLDAGAEPLDPFPGTQKPWRARCMKCGAEVRPRLYNLAHSGPCTNCAQPGLNLTAPTALYLLAGRGFLKAGITNLGKGEEQRMRVHARNGLTDLVARYEFESGFLAREAEALVVSALRLAAGEIGRVSSTELPDGWTEAVREDAFSHGRDDAAALVESLLRDSDTGVMIRSDGADTQFDSEAATAS